MSATIYEVRTRYITEDKATKALKGMESSAHGAARGFGALGSAVSTAVGAIAGFAGLRAAKSLFVDFNSSIEQSTISLAAQQKLLLGGRWESAMQQAGDLFGYYQRVAKASVGETRDFLEMHQGIAASAYRAGLGMEQVKKMTVGATIAAAALGERADMVALDVKQMLSGNVTSRDRTAQILLASQGVSQERFNKMAQAQRNALVLAALEDPAIKKAAKAMETSFAGVTSTFKDNLQIAAGKIGLPLFKAITAEIQKWNAWLDKNPEKLAAWGREFGRTLVRGFEVVKKIITFVVDNRDTLITLAKAVLISKGVGFVAGGLRGLVGSLQSFGGLLGGANQGLSGFAGALTKGIGVLQGLGLVYAGASAVAGLVDDAQNRDIKRQFNRGGMEGFGRDLFMSQFGAFDARDAAFAREHGAQAARQRQAERLVRLAREQGLMSSSGYAIDIGRLAGAYGFQTNERETLAGYLGARGAGGAAANLEAQLRMAAQIMAAQQRDTMVAAFETQIVPMFMQHQERFENQKIALWGRTVLTGDSGLSPLVAGVNTLVQILNAGAKKADEQDDAKKDPGQKPPSVHQHITIVSDDPDRIALPLARAARRAIQNPSQARTVFREA